MANEVTVPLLPCGSIDEIADFYRMLGFEVTYRQQRPNPYVALRREDLQLHFFGMPDFDPEQSYGSCLVYVRDTGELYREFAEGMRAVHGKLLVSGIPRMTRPRKRKNADNLSGFSLVDPGGNWIRIFQARDSGSSVPSAGRLGKALQSAVVLGDSHGDHRQAARILDSALTRDDDAVSTVDLVEALVYRAELAVALRDGETADTLLARVRATTLDDTDREALAEALGNAAELERVRDSRLQTP
ncbi:VOC family protein [Streptomyces sp. UNOB3_S3]|uniref:VOC family protein n=1 Tax=Streptomyces sp. UNOB3_S3 TaxID=2871682 RepID=UPI001E56569E|nr:VOC family protein [Streptomyces sp. UNOB3_S3]MCC3777633.1 VOC family protein [Streptomyces sp. UNOB3_S3]